MLLFDDVYYAGGNERTELFRICVLNSKLSKKRRLSRYMISVFQLRAHFSFSEEEEVVRVSFLFVYCHQYRCPFPMEL